MSEFKLKHNRIGVLTSGGDCAGLNAAIRAITYRAIQEYGLTVVGILASTAGLLQRPVRYRDLTHGQRRQRVPARGRDGAGDRQQGQSLRVPDAGRQHQGSLDGGDRGLPCARPGRADRHRRRRQRAHPRPPRRAGQIPFIGVPKTIDNDLAETDFAIGYMSAVEVCVDAADRLQPTAASHRRTMVLEVMGRDVGWIAIATGIAAGADVVLIPEIPFDIEKVAAHLRSRHARGQNHALVVCSEGVRLASGETVSHAFADGEVRYGGVGATIADIIARETGAETRVTVLGHVQRGGSPCAFDRILASSLGAYAVDLVVKGRDQPLCRLARTARRRTWHSRRSPARPAGLKPDGMMVSTARRLGICLGD